MTAVLLSIHVLAAILAVGPIAVAASLFPRMATTPVPVGTAAASGSTPVVTAAPSSSPGPERTDRRAAGVLHRICRVYTVVGVVVPVFGIATAAQMGVLTSAWVLVSLALTLVAAGVLGLAILPDQRRMLAAADGGAALFRRLTTATGVFNLLWAVVVVLMIVRPGSTTGV